ncbi:MAG: FAD-dependent oxidoreductase [Terrisporobacter sp.]
MKTIVIVGGGIGGLCTSIRLLSKGYKTILLEKENSLGGKINRKKYEQYFRKYGKRII